MIRYQKGAFRLRNLFRYNGSAFPSALPFALLSAFLGGLLKIFESEEVASSDEVVGKVLSNNAAYTAYSVLISFFVVFRTQTAYSRFWECCREVKKFQAEFFSTGANLVAFCRFLPAGQKPIDKRATRQRSTDDAVLQFQHILIRTLSLLHVCCLLKLRGGIVSEVSEVDLDLEVLDAAGLDEKSLDALKTSDNKVELVVQWVQCLTVDALATGTCTIPPPIASRIFQNLSNGLGAFYNAYRVAEIQYPFPYLQATEMLLLLHYCITPVVMCSFTSMWFFTALFSFLVVFSFAALNAIAQELEDPFGHDANDLNLHEMQQGMNTRLLMLMTERASNVPILRPGRTTIESHEKLANGSLAHAVGAIFDQDSFLESTEGQLNPLKGDAQSRSSSSLPSASKGGDLYEIRVEHVDLGLTRGKGGDTIKTDQSHGGQSGTGPLVGHLASVEVPPPPLPPPSSTLGQPEQLKGPRKEQESQPPSPTSAAAAAAAPLQSASAAAAAAEDTTPTSPAHLSDTPSLSNLPLAPTPAAAATPSLTATAPAPAAGGTAAQTTPFAHATPHPAGASSSRPPAKAATTTPPSTTAATTIITANPNPNIAATASASSAVAASNPNIAPILAPESPASKPISAADAAAGEGERQKKKQGSATVAKAKADAPTSVEAPILDPRQFADGDDAKFDACLGPDDQAQALAQDERGQFADREPATSGDRNINNNNNSNSNNNTNNSAQAADGIPSWWGAAEESLKGRFPELPAEVVEQALVDAGGHAGRAAKALRKQMEQPSKPGRRGGGGERRSPLSPSQAAGGGDGFLQGSRSFELLQEDEEPPTDAKFSDSDSDLAPGSPTQKRRRKKHHRNNNNNNHNSNSNNSNNNNNSSTSSPNGASANVGGSTSRSRPSAAASNAGKTAGSPSRSRPKAAP